jgi:hypothetical protein
LGGKEMKKLNILVKIFLLVGIISSNMYAYPENAEKIEYEKDSNSKNSMFIEDVLSDSAISDLRYFRTKIKNQIQMTVDETTYILNGDDRKLKIDKHSINILGKDNESLNWNGILTLDEGFIEKFDPDLIKDYKIKITITEKLLRNSISTYTESDIEVPISALINKDYLVLLLNKNSSSYKDGDQITYTFKITYLSTKNTPNLKIEEQQTSVAVYVVIRRDPEVYSGQIRQVGTAKYSLLNRTTQSLQMPFPRKGKGLLSMGINLDNFFKDNPNICKKERVPFSSIISRNCLIALHHAIFNYRDALDELYGNGKGLGEKYNFFEPYKETGEEANNTELIVNYIPNHRPQNDDTIMEKGVNFMYMAPWIMIGQQVACHMTTQTLDDSKNNKILNPLCGYNARTVAAFFELVRYFWQEEPRNKITVYPFSNGEREFPTFDDLLNLFSLSIHDEIASMPVMKFALNKLKVAPLETAFKRNNWTYEFLKDNNLSSLSNADQKRFWQEIEDFSTSATNSQESIDDIIDLSPITLEVNLNGVASINLNEYFNLNDDNITAKLVGASPQIGYSNYEDNNYTRQAEPFAEFENNNTVTKLYIPHYKELQTQDLSNLSLLITFQVGKHLLLKEVKVKLVFTNTSTTYEDDKKTCSATLEQSERKINLVSSIQVYRLVNPKPDEDCSIQVKSTEMLNEDETPSEDYIIVNYEDAKDLDNPSINLYKKFGLLQCTADAGNTNPNKVNMLSTKGIKQCGILANNYTGAVLKTTGQQIKLLKLKWQKVYDHDKNKNRFRKEIIGEMIGFLVKKIRGGPNLFIGGYFTAAGGQPANNIVRWDGNNYHPMGEGISGGMMPNVTALESWNNRIIIGGGFTEAGGQQANNIVSWDGDNYRRLGTGITSGVKALKSDNDQLFIGGRFTHAGGQPVNNIVRWDGNNYHPMGDGFNDIVYALEIFNDELHIGGRLVNDQAVNNIVRWDGDNYHQLFGTNGVNNRFHTLKVINDVLYIGGFFNQINNEPATNMVSWDGANINTAIGIANYEFNALGSFNGQVYMGGLQMIFHENPPANTLRWDGEIHNNLGVGVNGIVNAIVTFNNRLIIGGGFTEAGGQLASKIVGWDGDNYHPMGAGIGWGGFSAVNALLTHDYWEVVPNEPEDIPYVDEDIPDEHN